MNISELKDYINNQEPTFLTKAKRKGYVCPLCNNGTGTDGDGIVRDPNSNRYKCFKCGLYEDVISLIGISFNIDNFKEQCKKGAELYSINYEEIKNDYTKAPVQKNEHVQKNVPPMEKIKMQNYFDDCNKTLNEKYEGSYLQKRGISLETINRFNIGLDEHYKKSTGGNEWKAVIIPTGEISFTARNTDKTASDSNRYRKSEEAPLFNAGILEETNENVFVVEGEIDAISILQAGFNAVALSGTSGKNKLIEYIKEKNTNAIITYLPDNDGAGEGTVKYIKEKLKELDKECYAINLFGQYNCKDANEMLQRNAEEFAEVLEEINLDPAFYIQDKQKKTNALVVDLLEEIQKNKTRKAISTGFKQFDEILDGGLYEDFYILMAGTGHGKTALVMQIADRIAKAGNVVLYYNLEMANIELIARSISRETYELAPKDNYGNKIGSKSAREVMDGARWETYSEKEKDLIANAIDSYQEYCDNIVFHEAIGYYDTGKIDREMNYYVKKNGTAPVVIVDYLQMLSLGIALNSERKNLTERQAIDKAIADLKQISRKYKASVIALSSVNRETSKQENKEITQYSGKESGQIEYTAGTLISLDYAGRSNKDFREDKEAKLTPRYMKLKVHKNRYGTPKQAIYISYYSRNNYFEEVERNSITNWCQRHKEDTGYELHKEDEGFDD